MIKTFDYRRTLPELEADVLDAVRRVLHSNQLILGPETELFEAEFASFVGARHCIGVASGTAALQVSLLALGLRAGDQVITVANTCPPTAAAIRSVGAEPRFVDIDPSTCMLDARRLSDAYSERTRCIVPVHLWGHSVAMDQVQAFADAHHLAVIEDCAQAVGAYYHHQHVGTFGAVGCFSFYPTKNLGAFGDAGAIVTDSDALAQRCRRLRTYDLDADGVAQGVGLNARISEMQAAILRVKLPLLPRWLNQRRAVAARYLAELRHPEIHPAATAQGVVHAYHQFVVRCRRRDALQHWLAQQGVASGIHYATPLHLMPAFAAGASGAGALPHTEQAAQEILSLPVHESLTPQESSAVIEAVGRFPQERA